MTRVCVCIYIYHHIIYEYDTLIYPTIKSQRLALIGDRYEYDQCQPGFRSSPAVSVACLALYVRNTLVYISYTHIYISCCTYIICTGSRRQISGVTRIGVRCWHDAGRLISLLVTGRPASRVQPSCISSCWNVGEIYMNQPGFVSAQRLLARAVST